MADQQTVARLLIQLKADASEMKTDLEGARRTIGTFADNAKKLLGAIGITLGVSKLVSETKQLLTDWHAYNSQIEQSRIGIAGLILATTKIRNEQGKILEGEEKWTGALEMAAELYERIQAAAATTAATVPEITDGFQGMIGPGRAAGMNLDQILDTSILITQALNAMGQPMARMRTEAQGLLTGEIDRRSVIATSLQITKEQVLEAREQGRLYDLLNEKIGAFARAGQAQTETWAGLRSTLSDIINIFGARAQYPLFEAAKALVKDISDAIVTTEGGMLRLTESAQRAAEAVAGAIQGIIVHFRVFREEYGALMSVLVGALKALNVALGGLIFQGTLGFALLNEAVYRFFQTLNIGTLGTIPPLRRALKDMAEEQKRLWELVGKQADAASKAWGSWREPVFGTPSTEPDARLTRSRVAEEREDYIDPAALARASEAVKKLADRTKELQNEQDRLVNPVRGSALALELYIARATEGAHQTEELEQAVADLRDVWNTLEAQKAVKFRIEALDRAELSRLADDVKSAMQEIREQYESGDLDLERAFERRRVVLEESSRREIEVLQRRLARSDTEPEQISIRTEIDIKQAELRRNIIDLTREEHSAIKEVTEALREQQSAETYQRTETALQALNARYREGLVEIRAYYEERRVLAQERGEQEITQIEEQLSGTTEQAEIIRLQTQIMERKADLQRQITSFTHDETEALRQQSMEAMSLQTMYAGLQARAQGSELGPTGEMRAGFDEELAQMDERHALQLERIRTFNSERIELDGQYYEKAEAMAMVQELQQRERAQRIMDMERQVQLFRMQMAEEALGKLGTAFDQLYSASGEKLVGFFYLSKAVALAQAIVSTAAGIMKAWEQGGMYGSVMAGIIAAAGAAQVATIIATTIQGPGKKEGGLITEGTTPRADDVPIRVSRGEYVQPADVVDTYGVGVMEALRRKAIPVELFRGVTLRNVVSPAVSRFAEGGSTSLAVPSRVDARFPGLTDGPSAAGGGGSSGHTINVPVTLSPDDIRLAAALQDNVRDTVIRTLREFSS